MDRVVNWNRNYDKFLELCKLNRFPDSTTALEDYFAENPDARNVKGDGVIDWLKRRLPTLPKRCFRSACRVLGAYCQHKQNGDMYCVSCAAKINKYNPGLVRMPPVFGCEERTHREIVAGDTLVFGERLCVVAQKSFGPAGVRYDFTNGASITINEHQTVTLLVSPDTTPGRSNEGPTENLGDSA